MCLRIVWVPVTVSNCRNVSEFTGSNPRLSAKEQAITEIEEPVSNKRRAKED